MSPGLAAVTTAYIIVFGACIGSFLNVVIARLPENESIVRPPSRCPRCKQGIAWYDNLPILSWLLLRARCRKCRAPISARYPLVEMLTSAVFAALYVRFGLTWDLALWLPLSAALLAITFLDIDHWWVPDVITYPCMLWALLCSLLPERPGIVDAGLGLLPALLLWGVGFAFEKLLKKEGLGFGDVKLLALIGLAMGVRDTLTVLFLAALQGAIAGSLMLFVGGHTPPQPETPPAALADDPWTPPPRAIPFGPFLALATFEMALLPDVFVGWEQRLLASILGWFFHA